MAGRGNIANLKRYPKGVSGNPSGMPKLSNAIKLARKHEAKAIAVIVKALNGEDVTDLQFKAAQALLDRSRGRPRVESTTEDLQTRKLVAETALLESQLVEKQGTASDAPPTQEDIERAGAQKYGQELANASGKPDLH